MPLNIVIGKDGVIKYIQQLKKSCQNYAMQLSADYESPLTNYPQTFRRGSECFADCKNEA